MVIWVVIRVGANLKLVLSMSSGQKLVLSMSSGQIEVLVYFIFVNRRLRQPGIGVCQWVWFFIATPTISCFGCQSKLKDLSGQNLVCSL